MPKPNRIATTSTRPPDMTVLGDLLEKWQTWKEGAQAEHSPYRWVLKRASPGWRIGNAKNPLSIGRSKGAEYAALLMAVPGRWTTALSLASLHVTSDPSARDLVAELHRESADALVDAESERRIMAYLRDLNEEIATLPEGSARYVLATRERAEALRAAKADRGMGGRSRPFSGTASKASSSVSMAFARLRAEVGQYDPEFARWLRDHIDVGLGCRFVPDPDNPIDAGTEPQRMLRNST